MSSLSPSKCTSLTVPRGAEVEASYSLKVHVEPTENKNNYKFTATKEGDELSGQMIIKGTLTKIAELENTLKGNYEFRLEGSEDRLRIGTLTGTFDTQERCWHLQVQKTVYPETWILK